MSSHRDQPVETNDERLFDLSAGALCLDFVNTLPHRPRRANESLTAYSDLLAWSGQAGVLSAHQVERLARESAREPSVADRILRRAIRLREAMYRVFSTLAAGRSAPERDLAALNRALASALSRLRVTGHKSGFRWSWDAPEGALDRMLWPVVRSAAELLTSESRQLLRECAGDDCSWLFLDRSRSHRRRWCDMKTCGNRSKARRHYQRLKAYRSGA